MERDPLLGDASERRSSKELERSQQEEEEEEEMRRRIKEDVALYQSEKRRKSEEQSFGVGAGEETEFTETETETSNFFSIEERGGSFGSSSNTNPSLSSSSSSSSSFKSSRFKKLERSASSLYRAPSYVDLSDVIAEGRRRNQSDQEPSIKEDPGDPILPLTKGGSSRQKKKSASPSASSSSVVFGETVNPQVYENVFTVLWIVLMGSLAASISFWLPTITYPEDNSRFINVTSLFQNCFGSFVISICYCFSRVKHQYPQTYLMYAGIAGGFCSVFTTFGNVVADTGRLLLLGTWYLSILNILLNLILSIICYQIGRFISKKWKKQVKLVEKFEKLENIETRMAYEFEKQLAKSQHSNDRILFHSGGIVTKKNPKTDDIAINNIEKFISEQRDKSKRHTSINLTRRHKIIMGVCILPTVISSLVVIVILPQHVRIHLPDWWTNKDDPVLLYDYCITIILSVTGALVGGIFGTQTFNMKSQVQWGTFKVNMLSCILIGIAHNIVMFQSYLPLNDYTNVFIYRFVTSFCGSESSWGGLVNETMILWNGKTGRRRLNSFRNLFFNLFICLFVFFAVILSVRISVFFRYWSPQTAKLYLCSGGLSFLC